MMMKVIENHVFRFEQKSTSTALLFFIDPFNCETDVLTEIFFFSTFQYRPAHCVRKSLVRGTTREKEET